MILDTTAPSTAQVDALLEEWKKDAKLDKLELSSELRKIPSHQSKYLQILSTHRRAFQEGERRMTKMRRIKYEYYTGRLDQASLTKYGWQSFPFTLKGDLNTYMESDKDLLNARAVLSIHEEIVSICESIMKELNNRTWQLKEICGWEKYIGGSH